jgi:NitT/TauT family transport system ATP-binding protein
MTSTIERTDANRTGAPALTLRGVGKTFGAGSGAVTALRTIDLQVQPGEFVCLLGASGCGKSTLLNLVADLDAPTVGELQVGTARPSFMFQEAALLPWLTARRNIELALQLAGQGRRERRIRADELLALVRLEGQGDKRPHELSGGMRQRVSLARALAVDPELILLDESFSQLDHVTSQSLRRDFCEVARAHGKTCLLVTHRIEDAVEMADRIIVLAPGGRIRLELTVPVRAAGRGADEHRHMRSRIEEALGEADAGGPSARQ